MLTDTAAVTGLGPHPDPSTAHATAVARILAGPLTITKRASATHVHSGAAVSFDIRVSNRSGAAVRHVSVCDRLPTGLAYVAGGTLRGSQICWNIRSLAPGRSRTFMLRARAVASRTERITNIATARSPGIATRSARAPIVISNPAPPTVTG